MFYSSTITSYIALQYGYDDDLDGSRKKKKKKKADVNIYDIYEPFDLEKGHFTMQDHEIKMTDLPERYPNHCEQKL